MCTICPTKNLTNKKSHFKIIFITIVFCATLLVSYFTFGAPALNRLAALKEKTSELKSKTAALAELENSSSALHERWQKLKNKHTELKYFLPSSASLPQIMQELDLILAPYQGSIVSFNVEEPEEEAGLASLKFRLVAAGSPYKLQKLLKEVEGFNSHPVIDLVQWENTAGQNLLEADFTVYFIKEE